MITSILIAATVLTGAFLYGCYLLGKMSEVIVVGSENDFFEENF